MEHTLSIGTAGRKVIAVLFAALTLLATAPDANAAKFQRAYTPYRLPPIITPSAARGRQNTNTPTPVPRVVPSAGPRTAPRAAPRTVPTTTPTIVPPTTTPTIPPKAPATTPSTPVIVDVAPQIGGAPRTSLKVGEAYSFVPVATDANSDKLSFDIANKPSWLNFSATTGALTGTPTAAQVGIHRNVTIQVTANGKYATLPAFNIEVISVAPRGVTLSWSPPTQNDDGSALTNLAGYKIRYGAKSGSYTTAVTLSNPGIASHFIEGLVTGTYYFVISAFNTTGDESNFSNEAAKIL